MGLVFMGAIVEPVYLVPALTAVLALGLTAEARQRTSADDVEIVDIAAKEDSYPPS
jgi:hypothetical protein